MTNAANQPTTVTLRDDIVINRLGLGTNRIEDDAKSRSILQHATQNGVNFIDTADIYTKGVSEQVVGQTLSAVDGVTIATKGGYHGARPDQLQAAIDNSLTALNVDAIDLYYLHRPDPDVPFEDSVGVLAAAHQAGKLRHVALSNVNVLQIQQAGAIVPISAVQNEYNLGHHLEEEDVITYCEHAGIVFVPFYPLRGSAAAESIAQTHGATANQVVLAWMLARSPIIAPIPGTRSPEHLDENLAAIELALTDEELKQLIK